MSRNNVEAAKRGLGHIFRLGVQHTDMEIVVAMRQDELDEVVGIELLKVLKVSMIPALVLIVNANDSDSGHHALSSNSLQMFLNTVI